MRSPARQSWGVLVATVCAACGGDDGVVVDPEVPYGEASAPLFDTTRLLEIDIEVAAEDWDQIRVEHYDLYARLVDDCPGPLPDDPYTVVPATVTIDGERFTDVGLRKKGFLGSANRERPSLKLSFDEYDPEREVHGLERMTLNNNQQDTSHLDTCLAYQVFAAAGTPAPRCNWARVTVNGEDLGVFSHVESVRRRYLGLHFDDTSGNLYEGQVADFRDVWIDNYEDKRGNDGDRSDLDALVAAVASSDDELLAELDAVLDVDAFLTFWATEVLVGHWDGYAGNRNNHYLYRDPSTGRFHFLPWGPDAAFGDPNPFLPQAPPDAVWASGELTRRLYAHPDTHARYQARLRELLDDVWDEDALLDEIDRVAAMIRPHVIAPGGAFDDAVDLVRAFVQSQRDRLVASLDADPAWPFAQPESYCVGVAGTASGTFSTTYDQWPPSNLFGGTGTLEVTLNGTPMTFSTISAGAGPDDAPMHPRTAATTFGFVEGGDVIFPLMLVENELWSAGERSVDGYDVFGVLVQLDLSAPDQPTLLGFLRGTMTLDAAPVTQGDTVSGSFDLEILGGPF